MADQILMAKLYPTLTPQELKEADENLDAYLGLIFRIYERIASDPAKYAELRRLLTESQSFHTIEAKVEPKSLNEQ